MAESAGGRSGYAGGRRGGAGAPRPAAGFCAARLVSIAIAARNIIGTTTVLRVVKVHPGRWRAPNVERLIVYQLRGSPLVRGGDDFGEFRHQDLVGVLIMLLQIFHGLGEAH